MVVCLRVAVIWASLAGIPTSFKLSEDANETEVSQVSSGGGLYSFGATVAIYNPRYQRLVQMHLLRNYSAGNPAFQPYLISSPISFGTRSSEEQGQQLDDFEAFWPHTSGDV